VNLSQCGSLATGPETGIWYRAVEPQYWRTSLQTLQTMVRPSRFDAGAVASPPFEVLYLAEDFQVALFEAEALLGSPDRPGGVLPQPRLAWTIINVKVQLQRVADLTTVAAQTLLATTAQELTGDWRGYHLRSPRTSVSEPIGLAPTQELGAALYAVPELEGFRTLSAKVPYAMNLVVFPQKLQPGSRVEFSHPTLGTHTIPGPAALP
jgi:RES domain-containing protein